MLTSFLNLFQLSELEKISEERNSTESQINSLQNEVEEVKSRELSLSKELELLNQVRTRMDLASDMGIDMNLA